MIVTLALLCGGWGATFSHKGKTHLAAMILLYTDKAKKELKQQEEMMLLNLQSYLITEEVNATTDHRRSSTTASTTFMASSCMQRYGFYHEIDHLIETSMLSANS